MRPLKRSTVQLNGRITLKYIAFVKPKGRHVLAMYAVPGTLGQSQVLVGEFKSWQKNKYVAGKNTTFMHRESWVAMEECEHGNPADHPVIGRTFGEWKRALLAHEIVRVR